MEPILIPPGKTQNWKCPQGTPLKVGQILSGNMGEKTTPVFVVLKSDGTDIVLGPLTAGIFEVLGLCSDQAPVAFSVEAPDPANVEKNIQPLSPVAMSYPWWIWLVLLLVAAFVAATVWGVRRLLAPKKEGNAAASRLRLRKTPVEKMEIFLSKAEQQKLTEKPDTASAQMLYGEGLSHLRRLLQEAYKFKSPGATTTEFIGEVKTQAVAKKSILSATQLAQLESTFMQAKQVTYAKESPERALRQAFLKSLKDFSEHLKSTIFTSMPPPPSRKPIFKRKPKS